MQIEKAVEVLKARARGAEEDDVAAAGAVAAKPQRLKDVKATRDARHAEPRRESHSRPLALSSAALSALIYAVAPGSAVVSLAIKLAIRDST